MKVLESSPDIESSPELSESFELYLQQRKKKIENIKKGAAATGTTYSPTSSRADPQRDSMMSNMTTYGPDDTLMQCTDDSFMQNEKMCENTLHLNNVSEHLFDLTTLDDSIGEPRRSIKKGESFNDTHLMSIEAPSFMFNNTSLMSPNKHSPLQAVHANRPSTIMEVSELSLNRTGLSSYRTAESRSQISEDFKTADEGSYTEDMMIKMPKIRTFYDYNATSSDMSKDSLEVTRKTSHSEEMTKDSLNICDSSSGVDSSYDQRDESQNASQGDEKLNDTLEQIEYMLAQHQKIQQQKTPRLITGSPSTPMPKPKSKHLQPKAFALPGSASKHSPLIKFSPHSRNSPQTNVASEPTFKRPMVSASKIPQPSLSSKKYQHIVSPISRYIKHTPGAPLSSTARALPGMESSPNRFNFRDSEGFPNENESMNANSGGGSSLPFLAKTKSSTVSHVRIHKMLPLNVFQRFIFCRFSINATSRRRPEEAKFSHCWSTQAQLSPFIKATLELTTARKSPRTTCLTKPLYRNKALLT